MRSKCQIFLVFSSSKNLLNTWILIWQSFLSTHEVKVERTMSKESKIFFCLLNWKWKSFFFILTMISILFKSFLKLFRWKNIYTKRINSYSSHAMILFSFWIGNLFCSQWSGWESWINKEAENKIVVFVLKEAKQKKFWYSKSESFSSH
jgi:hypothetical protein